MRIKATTVGVSSAADNLVEPRVRRRDRSARSISSMPGKDHFIGSSSINRERRGLAHQRIVERRGLVIHGENDLTVGGANIDVDVFIQRIQQLRCLHGPH